MKREGDRTERRGCERERGPDIEIGTTREMVREGESERGRGRI